MQMLKALDVSQQQSLQAAVLIDRGFNIVTMINCIYRFRRFDTSEPKTALSEMVDRFGSNTKSEMANKIGEIVEKLGCWNREILLQQLNPGT